MFDRFVHESCVIVDFRCDSMFFRSEISGVVFLTEAIKIISKSAVQDCRIGCHIDCCLGVPKLVKL